MYTLGGSRPPAFQFPATDIPSSSTPPMSQPSTFDTAVEDQLDWDEFGCNDILATRDGAPQQVEEFDTSQLTQPPPVLTQPSQLAAGRATPAGGRASPAGGEVTPDVAGSSQAAMATPSPDHIGPRVVRAPDPWTYDRDHTWAGARAVRGKRGRRI
jgi:hypothetical protein